MLQLTAHEENIYATIIMPIQWTYGDSYKFKKSLYYDAMAHPHNNFVALFVTARKLALLGTLQTKHVEFTRNIICCDILNKDERLVLRKYRAVANQKSIKQLPPPPQHHRCC
ncbi:hypothetical protein H4R19_005406 [Coemansia spiralis]|nr:hypothetical protein H4R19_005406 [Coemansia spiralis]